MTTEPTENDITTFTAGAWRAALFTFGLLNDNPTALGCYPFSSDDAPEVPDNAFGLALRKDCAAFLASNWSAAQRYAPNDLGRVGELFHYARNGHGIGFDDDQPDPDNLQAAAQAYGECALDVGSCGVDWDDLPNEVRDAALPEAAPKGERSPAWQDDTVIGYAKADHGWSGWGVCAEYAPDEWADLEGDDRSEYERRCEAREHPWIAYMTEIGCMGSSCHVRGATESEAMHDLLNQLAAVAGDSGPCECTEAAYMEWLADRIPNNEDPDEDDDENDDEPPSDPVERAIWDGFDETERGTDDNGETWIRYRCSQCNAMRINGVLVHESAACPNERERR